MLDTKETIGKVRDLLSQRLSALNEEKSRIEKALANLDGETRRATPKRSRRRRSRRGGTRADEAVQLVEQRPGITASEIAKAMKIKPNYLYRVLAELEKQGRVKKDGRSYSPAS